MDDLQVSISSIVRWKSYIINCYRDTLIKLEIDHSMRVSDGVVPDLLKLQNLKLLSMAGILTRNDDLLLDCEIWMEMGQKGKYYSKCFWQSISS